MRSSKKQGLKSCADICCLSGLPILHPQDWTREHYAPKSRVPAYISQAPYNIRPALKIINSIKGNLFPCEWKELRLERCWHAIINYNIRPRERQQIADAIRNYENAPADENPCENCICKYYPDFCIKKLALDKGR